MNSELTSPQIQELAQKRVWVLDIDDCLYPMDNVFHRLLKGNVIKVFNRLVREDGARTGIVDHFNGLVNAQGISLDTPIELTLENLGLAYPPLVQAVYDLKEDEFDRYMEEFYGDYYSLISHDNSLVRAFKVAQDKGIEIYLYTNGLSSAVPGEMAHAQKVLRRLGFGVDEIERLRPRIYDLMMAIQDGGGKPTVKGFEKFLSFAGICDPEQAMMADDTVDNLATAHGFGLSTMWTHTSWRDDPCAANVKKAEEIRAIRVRHTGAALHQIAMAA